MAPEGVVKEKPRERTVPIPIRTVVGRRPEVRNLKAAAVALFVGVALVFTAGFSHSSTIHNAGHDTRHALSFPCH